MKPIVVFLRDLVRAAAHEADLVAVVFLIVLITGRGEVVSTNAGGFTADPASNSILCCAPLHTAVPGADTLRLILDSQPRAEAINMARNAAQRLASILHYDLFSH